MDVVRGSRRSVRRACSSAVRRYFWTTEDLRRAGRTKRETALLVDAGRLRPVRIGLYAEPDAPVELVRAARTGGAATATTAGEALGLWTPPDDRLQIAVPSGATRLRDPDDATLMLQGDEAVCVHWTARMPSPRMLIDRIAPLLLVLEHAVRCLRPEYAVSLIDSALHERKLQPSQLALLAAALPAHLRPIVAAVDGRADAGLESVVRYLLRALGLDVVVHPILDGIGEVDLLVAGRLIIETDGKRYHTAEQAFQNDRRRDREAALRGYRVLRLTYQQVVEEWPTTVRAIFAILAAAA